MKVHHNTLKKARTHHIQLVIRENEICAIKEGAPDVVLASGLQGNIVLDQAIARLNGALTGTPGSRAKLAEAFKNGPKAAARKPAPVETNDDEDQDGGDDEPADDQDEGDDDQPEGASVVKRKYKQAYRPFHMTCGDDIARDVSAHVSVATETGTCIDRDKLRRFAKANDCWDAKYEHLNIGMARMNVGNRLRAKVKKGHSIKWA